MAQTKTKELRELKDTELKQRLHDLRHESLNLRLQQATGQLENTARIRTVRREIAKILTLINQRRQQA